MITPPKILKAGMVNPNNWKMYFPIKIEAATIIKAKILALLAICSFFFSSSPSVS